MSSRVASPDVQDSSPGGARLDAKSSGTSVTEESSSSSDESVTNLAPALCDQCATGGIPACYQAFPTDMCIPCSNNGEAFCSRQIVVRTSERPAAPPREDHDAASQDETGPQSSGYEAGDEVKSSSSAKGETSADDNDEDDD